MKYLILLLLCYSTVFCQVGIGTVSPTTTLDVNGSIRVRVVPQEANLSSVKDSVLVVNNGYIKSVPSTSVVQLALPSQVKGTLTTSGTVNLSLSTGSQTIPFDQLAFDSNNEFNSTTHQFVAKQQGIYSINVQIRASSSIGVATNFGTMIIKNGTVINRNSFPNIGVLGVNVTPPVRQVESLVQLNVGDVISFSIEGDVALGSVNLEGDNTDSFFSIHQVR